MMPDEATVAVDQPGPWLRPPSAPSPPRWRLYDRQASALAHWAGLADRGLERPIRRGPAGQAIAKACPDFRPRRRNALNTICPDFPGSLSFERARLPDHVWAWPADGRRSMGVDVLSAPAPPLPGRADPDGLP